MSGTVPPPPPPGGRPDEGPGAPTQDALTQAEQLPPVPDPAGQQTSVQPAAQQGPVPPPPVLQQPPAPQAPVQRVSTANRMPPAISPPHQFAQAVTPAPAAPGAPVVQSMQNPGGDPAMQQYYPEQYQPVPGQYAPQGYAPQAYDQYGRPVYAGQPAYAYQEQQPQARPERRKLSPGWIAFIALDVLLVVAAVVFAVNLLGSDVGSPTGSESSVAAEESTEPDTEEGLETNGGPDVQTFAAPSLNITCTLSPDGATCGIAQLDQKPAPDPSCGGASGYVAKVDPNGNVTQPCVGKKDQPKTAGGNVAVLAYEATKRAHGFTCASEMTGMTCVADATGTGFSIARAGIADA